MVNFNHQVVKVKPGKNPGRIFNLSITDFDETPGSSEFNDKISEFDESKLSDEEKAAITELINKIIENHNKEV